MDNLTVFADLSPIGNIFASNTVATFDGFAAAVNVNGVVHGHALGRSCVLLPARSAPASPTTVTAHA